MLLYEYKMYHCMILNRTVGVTCKGTFLFAAKNDKKKGSFAFWNMASRVFTIQHGVLRMKVCVFILVIVYWV